MYYPCENKPPSHPNSSHLHVIQGTGSDALQNMWYVSLFEAYDYNDLNYTSVNEVGFNGGLPSRIFSVLVSRYVFLAKNAKNNHHHTSLVILLFFFP